MTTEGGEPPPARRVLSFRGSIEIVAGPEPAGEEAPASRMPLPVRPRPLRRLRDLPRRVKLGGAISLGSVATGVTLFLTLLPQLDPARSLCPKEYSAHIAVNGVTSATFADYLSELVLGSAGRAQRELRQRGVIVAAVVTTSGYNGRRLALRWSLLRTKQGPHLPNADLVDQTAFFLVPQGCKDQVAAPIFVRAPERPVGQVYAELTLFDGKVPLEQARTPEPFSL